MNGTRRYSLKLLFGIVAFQIAGARADITVVSWGGAYTKSQQEAYGKTWEQKTGQSIRWVEYNGGLDEIRAQVESGDVRWDVVDVFAHEARIGCDEELFEPLPRERFSPAPDGTSMTQDLTVPIPNDCVVPNIIWSWLTFYDRTRFPDEKPTTIADFFDVERFPGKRGISAFPQANVEMALVADGVDPKRVYEVMDTAEGIDRAFAMLDRIRGQAVFWSSGTEPVELVESGRVVMSTAYNGRVGDAVLSRDAPFVAIWDGQMLDEEWFVMVAGTKNREQALDFLIHASAPKQQAAQARWITYGPMRRSALAIIAAGEPWYHTGVPVMPQMPNRAEVMPRTIVADPDWWAEHGARITERYKAWMQR